MRSTLKAEVDPLFLGGNMSRYYAAQYYVHSFTHPDKDPYKVSQRANDGGWECDCGAWIYQRKRLHNGRAIKKHELPFLDYVPNGFCKHIMHIRQNRNLEADMETYRETGEHIEVVMNGRIKAFINNI